jgi:hypothetical protein
LWVAYILVLEWRVNAIGREFCRMARADTLKDAKGCNAVNGMEAIGPGLHERLSELSVHLKKNCRYEHVWGDEFQNQKNLVYIPSPLDHITHTLVIYSDEAGFSLRMVPTLTGFGYLGYYGAGRR